jgi:hypothetical protein
MNFHYTIYLFPCLVCTALAQTPDRAPLSDEWGYRPAEGQSVSVNPPALSWVHEKGVASYTVEWADNDGFRRPVTVTGIPWSVYTHHRALRPGRYWWRYRIVSKSGQTSPWSRARGFVVPASAVSFPQPTVDELRRRIPKTHPRLLVRAQDLKGLRNWAQQGGRTTYEALIREADRLCKSEPTPEPTIRANGWTPPNQRFWWPNHLQTVKALQEAEVLTFVWVLTREEKYAEPARRFTLRLAGWDPDGPTNFRLNDECGMPMLYRLARAYDWGWPLFTEAERKQIRAALLRRALDAWNDPGIGQGAGHFNHPYGSHDNRTWHKLAENAIATFHETPESEQFLHFAVSKFFGAYPVWSDDDGGWHEGVGYLCGYMMKLAPWIDTARKTLGIDVFRKPFFAHFGDYMMYSAPPGSPDLGFGDESHGRPGNGYWCAHSYTRQMRNPYWTWWVKTWEIPTATGEPVLDFLWSAGTAVEPKAPVDLPPSKVFRGTGVAVLNTELTDSSRNVQIRFKASPMGRFSHGHDPHNSFTLNAYGVPLLVCNAYRGIHGGPFHSRWVWSTRSQNAVLVDGFGQKPHSLDLGGHIVKWQFQDGLDYVQGDATAAYEGRLKRARRHVILLKPDVVVIADDLEAPRPSTFQWMLHGQQPFVVDEPAQQLVLDRGTAGVVVDYAAEEPLGIRQWTGYDPEPDKKLIADSGFMPIPPQWHVEASSTRPSERVFVLTVLRVFRRGQAPGALVRTGRGSSGLTLRIGEVIEMVFPSGNDFALVRRGERQWRIE